MVNQQEEPFSACVSVPPCSLLLSNEETNVLKEDVAIVEVGDSTLELRVNAVQLITV